jgi:redox-sensitive bicupin YhaK (pirin superfamily)
MRAPWYRDIPSEAIPEFVTGSGVKVRVIAGQSHGVEGAVRRDVTEPLYLDIELPAGATFAQALPASHNAFVYVYRGRAEIAGTPIPVQRMAILANGADTNGVVIRASEPTRALLIAGRPLGEPIAQYGPFVMNTNDEIHQAVRDYQSGNFAAAQ